MVTMFSDKRFKIESYFMDIGKALHKATEGSQAGLDEWIKISNEKKTALMKDIANPNILILTWKKLQ